MTLPALLDRFLSDVRDIFTTWTLGKYLKLDHREYCLEHSKPNLDILGPSYTSEIQNIILDETSILVLNDLGLLEHCLAYFNQIEINKYTFEQFSKLSHPIFGSLHSNIAKEILNTLGGRLDKITTVGRADDEQNLVHQYDKILSKSNSNYFCSDDLYLCEFLRSDHKDTYFINSVVLIDILHANSQIDSGLKASSLEKLCTLGISSVYLTWDHVNFLIYQHMMAEENISLLSTDFKHVFDVLFPADLPFDDALNQISTIFSNTLNVSDSEVDITYLAELLPVWVVRYPKLDIFDLLAHWFVHSCWKTKYILESKYVKRAKGQGKLLKILADFLQSRGKNGLDKIFISISKKILSFNPKLASNVYENVKTSFIEDSPDYKAFSRIYSQMAIEHRIKEAKL